MKITKHAAQRAKERFNMPKLGLAWGLKEMVRTDVNTYYWKRFNMELRVMDNEVVTVVVPNDSDPILWDTQMIIHALKHTSAYGNSYRRKGCEYDNISEVRLKLGMDKEISVGRGSDGYKY